MEYAVLNVPGFKVIKGSGSDWTRIHNGEKATSPFVNPDRWWTGIHEFEVAEFISLTSKIRYWTPRQKKRDFDREKFVSYKDSLEKLKEKYDEGEIYIKMAQYSHLDSFLPKVAVDVFIF